MRSKKASTSPVEAFLFTTRCTVHSRPRRLRLNYLCFGHEHFLPPGFDLFWCLKLLCELQEAQVMAVLRGPEPFVKFGEFWVGARGG